MKPLRTRLQEARQTLGVPWEVIERDYLLSWVLAGISRVEKLRNTLIFKGGTSLKKCWFGDYRFSEDLDFSGVSGVPRDMALEDAIQESCRIAARLLDEYAPVEITCERYTETDPHPGGQEAFTIHARFPWHRVPHTRVMIEISMDEQALRYTPWRTVIHGYGEPLDANMRAYSLEEIMAEKLRAILQHIQKLDERGWSRSRARDYYDLWRIFNAYSDHLTLTGFAQVLRDKCAARGVSFRGADDFFQSKMLAYVEQTWDQWLGPLVPDLPAYATVIGELRPKVDALLSIDRKAN